MDNIVDNIGLPYSGINMAYSNSGTIGPADADVLISLKEGHAPTADYVKELRTVLPQKFTGTTFAFLPPDIVSQVLNFGLPAPIDVQVVGPDEKASYAYATDLLKRVRMVPGIADLRVQQAFDYPQLNVDVNRSLAGIVGLTQQDVANSLLVTLSGSGQVKPNFWLNTNNGVSYPIVVQIPQYWMSSVSDLVNLPITSPATKTPQLLGGLARITPGPSAAVVSHYDVQPVIDIYGAVQGRDLGAVARDVARVLKEAATSAPRGTHVVMRGQVQTMISAYSQLFFGLAGAIVLVYLVIVVNFQSWLDPFIIITALPGALAGIVWMLFITGTTLSIPALTGAIMCMGIAWIHAFPSRADDGRGHDFGHDPDGARHGRRRRAERPARARGHWWPFARDGHNAVLRSRRFQCIASQGSQRASGRDFLSLVISSALRLIEGNHAAS
jgi:multidrug efflux pump subunit AcrB